MSYSRKLISAATLRLVFKSDFKYTIDFEQINVYRSQKTFNLFLEIELGEFFLCFVFSWNVRPQFGIDSKVLGIIWDIY